MPSSNAFRNFTPLTRCIARKCAAGLRPRTSELQALLARNNTVTPEIEGKLSEAAQIRADCQAAMLAHFCEVSRTMPPAEGKRYLAWVSEKTLGSMQNMSDTSAKSAHDTGHH